MQAVAHAIARKNKVTNEEQLKQDDTFLKACANGEWMLVAVLLKGGADPRARTADGRTALHFAAGHGYIEALRLLMQTNADPAAEDDCGFTPADWASRKGHAGAVKVLNDLGANFGAEDADIPSVISRKYKMLPLQLITIEDAAEGQAQQEKNAIFLAACAKGDWMFVALLLDGGADPNALAAGNSTALHFAAGHGNIEALKLLMQSGADPAVKDNRGRTVAHYASQYGQVETLTFLSDLNLDIGAADCDGITPAYLAAVHGRIVLNAAPNAGQTDTLSAIASWLCSQEQRGSFSDPPESVSNARRLRFVKQTANRSGVRMDILQQIRKSFVQRRNATAKVCLAPAARQAAEGPEDALSTPAHDAVGNGHTRTEVSLSHLSLSNHPRTLQVTQTDDVALSGGAWRPLALAWSRAPPVAWRWPIVAFAIAILVALSNVFAVAAGVPLTCMLPVNGVCVSARDWYVTQITVCTSGVRGVNAVAFSRNKTLVASGGGNGGDCTHHDYTDDCIVAIRQYDYGTAFIGGLELETDSGKVSSHRSQSYMLVQEHRAKPGQCLTGGTVITTHDLGPGYGSLVERVIPEFRSRADSDFRSFRQYFP